MAISPPAANPALAAYTQATKRAQSAVEENAQPDQPSFHDLLVGTISDAVDASKTSESMSIRAASGQVDLQDVVEAVNAAEIGLQTVVSVRDRVISAYQEIMRMPI